MTRSKFPTVPYDIVSEMLAALLVVAVVVVALAAFKGAPYHPTLTIQQVANADPVTFEQTAMGDLTGTGAIASYGPPYNNNNGSVQSLGPIAPQTWLGVTIPVNAAEVDVLNPLRLIAPMNPAAGSALAAWLAASPAQQQKWASNYNDALGKATVANRQVVVPAGDYGPVPAMMTALLQLGRSGLMESALDYNGNVYNYDFTNALLFLQGAADHHLAGQLQMKGEQWGIIHEEQAGYPGAWWVAPYSALYQIPPYNSSPAGDLLVGLTMVVMFLVLLLVPWIPGVNQLPRYLGVYRLIWRDYYRHPARGARQVVARATASGHGSGQS